MTRSEIAANKFKDGYCCSQAVLFSFADKAGITEDLALRLADGFGAGMGRKQEVCGAVSGSILTLSLLYGRGKNESEEKHEYTYDRIRDFMARFETLHGSIICRRLLDDLDLNTDAGQERFKNENWHDACTDYVADAARILDQLIDEHPKE